MSGNSVVLDTSVAIAVLAGRAGSLLSHSVEQLLLPVPVIGELRYGALNSRRSAENLAEVERLVSGCRVLEITAMTAAVYGGFLKDGTSSPESVMKRTRATTLS